MITEWSGFFAFLRQIVWSEVSKESSLRRKSLVIDLRPDTLSWIFDSEELTPSITFEKDPRS